MNSAYATTFKLLTLGYHVIPSGGGNKGIQKQTQLGLNATQGLLQCSPRSSPGYSVVVFNSLRWYLRMILPPTKLILHMVIDRGKTYGKGYGQR